MTKMTSLRCLRFGTIAMLLGLGFAGCAQPAPEKSLDQKVSAEPEFKGTADLVDKDRKTIATAPGITDDQRTKLLALHESASRKLSEIHEESLKLRALLVQNLVSKDYDATETKGIEKRLKGLNDEELKTIIDAAKKVNTILGRAHPQSAQIMREFAEEHEGRERH